MPVAKPEAKPVAKTILAKAVMKAVAKPKLMAKAVARVVLWGKAAAVANTYNINMATFKVRGPATAPRSSPPKSSLPLSPLPCVIYMRVRRLTYVKSLLFL